MTTTTDLSNLSIGSPTSSSGLISIPGIASGLNTSAIISEIISLDSQPMIQLQLEQDNVEEQSTQLTNIQNALSTVATDATNLSGPGLFDTTSTASSSNPTTITATAASGAAVGGYQVDVTALANSAQRTFTYASPASDDTMTIDGQSLTVAAGTSLSDFAAQVNNDSNLDVYAAVENGSTVVLSNRATGDTGSNFIQVSDPGNSITATGAAQEGQDAAYNVDGTSGTSASNTVTDAIPGVTLTLGGLTTTSGAVTVTVSPPTASTTSIATAVNQFVSDYNSAVNLIETQLTQTPVTGASDASDAEQGSLYNDSDLGDLLTNMRQAMYTGGTGLPNGMAALSDIGISTGAPTGDAAPTTASLAGDLTVDTSTLDSAIENNPSGVAAVLNSFSASFQSLVNAESGPGGVISQRISDDASQTNDMSNQITVMQSALTEQQTQLQNEYTALETTISASQSQETELESEIAQLPSTSSSSSSA
jgi:flagellar hook-associated protein 2